MPGCKPDDLAEFLPQAERNAGRRVIVNHACSAYTSMLGMKIWHCTALQLVYDPIQGADIYAGEMCHAPDKLLRPIRPDELVDDERDSKVDRVLEVIGARTLEHVRR